MTNEHLVIDSQNKKKISPILILTVFITCFGSSMLYGYNMAVINLPADRIKCFLNKTILNVPCRDAYNSSNPIFNSTVNNVESGSIDANFLYAQTSTVFVIAGVIGAFSTGWIADLVGRRNGLLLNHVFVIIGGIINGLTVKTSTVSLLYIGRFFIGINSGITIGLASMYLTEIAPRAYRGAIGACHQLAVTLGIVIGYILTMTHTLNTDSLWPVACACTAIPAVLSLCILPFCPESPRFIFLKKHNVTLTRKEFTRINQLEDVDIFIGELQEESDIAKSQPKFKFIQIFTQKELRMPLIIACLIQVMQQISGINAVISYSSSMLNTAGIPEIYSQYCVITIGVLNVVCTLVSLPLLEKFGRRTLLLWPSILLAGSLLFLTIFVNLANASGTLSIYGQKVFGGISVFFIMTYIIGFAFGLGPVPALIVAEIFRQEPRGAAYSISQAIQWAANLIVLFSYPNMNKAIGGYSFLPFLVVVIICWVFFYLYMPETKNRTFDDVARDLAFGTTVISKKKSQTLNRPIYDKVSTNENDTETVA
uniref:Slc2a-2 n=1 Tax=Schmidtea mediterranea TaxID=79327 RepID=A0A0H3YF13_SCHMD|nr:slc2a-2 [Schmidtea mediterranea]